MTYRPKFVASVPGERVAERAAERISVHATSTAALKAAERAAEAIGGRALERSLERAGAAHCCVELCGHNENLSSSCVFPKAGLSYMG
jgi:hypothetical protein